MIDERTETRFTQATVQAFTRGRSGWECGCCHQPIRHPRVQCLTCGSRNYPPAVSDEAGSPRTRVSGDHPAIPAETIGR